MVTEINFTQGMLAWVVVFIALDYRWILSWTLPTLKPNQYYLLYLVEGHFVAFSHLLF